MAQQGIKYIFRPKTIPMSRNRSRSRRRDRRDQPARDTDVISRPQQNFFKLVFKRDTYLWLIFHKNIKRVDMDHMTSLYHKFQEAYHTLGLEEKDLPICTDINEVKHWTSEYQCKIAMDETVIDYFDEVLAHPHCIMVKVVTEKNIEVVRKIRKSAFSHKIRSVDDNYDNILVSVRQDMEKVKILKEADKLEKVRLPNFMKLKIKDKAELISYRSNIYGLANLHNNKVDLETSKKRFIQQCQKMYHTESDKKFMKYYLTYPFNHREILKFYTEDTFFYRCLNNTLRVAKDTQEFFIIGDPFNKMFHAIKNIYKQQFPYSQSRKDLKLYRGADLSQSQCKYLQSCIGSYIQIHGFVSTTLDPTIAQKFAKDRKHNKIIQIIFDDIADPTSPVLENDYGFVNLLDISSYQQNQILFNTLNIFKVVGKETRDDFQYFILKYGTIFNVLNKPNPQILKRDDRLAYYTYKELMGEKDHLNDLGQVFLKSNQTQKCVDYYQAKIIQAKGQNRAQQVQLIIKKSEALILNGQPAKALEHMIILLTERKNIKHTSSGARFLQAILSDKEEIIKQIDITKKYSAAGHSLDKFDEAESQLTDTNQAIQDALKQEDGWDFDIAFGQFQVKMQIAHIKQSMQNYKEMMIVLKETEVLINEILQKAKESDISFHNHKKIYLEKTLIYQLMAKISEYLEGQNQIDLVQLQKKYSQTQAQLSNLIEQKSYDKSLIQIRKIQIERRRQDFNKNKQNHIKKLQQSLVSIKETSVRDDEIPKTYHMLAEIEQSTKSVASTNTAISYLQKEFLTQSHYYGQNDPRSIKTVIDIAQCHRNLKDPQESIDILRQQMKIVPFKNKPKHTIVTKTLYTMGMAYLDIGEFSYALKCFEKALNMLKQILSKRQLQKYHHKYKLQLQMGRTLTFLLRYNEAQENLSSYHNFIVKLYNNQHSDIANSLNHFGILYLKQKFYDQAKNKFQQSAEMFKMTSGEKALVVAKIKCNLGMIYSIIPDKDKEKALRYIDEANYLFNEIYFKGEGSEESIHSETYMVYYYYAEIYKIFKDYREALNNYEKSRQALKQYKEKKQKEREAKGTTMLSQFASINAATRIFTESKKDNHQLVCRVKIIQCKAKLKQKNFWGQLEKVIRELQKETIQYNEIENTKIDDNGDKVVDKGSVSQLKNLLNYCRTLYAHYEKNRKVNKDAQLGVTNLNNIKQELEEEEDIQFNTNVKQQI